MCLFSHFLIFLWLIAKCCSGSHKQCKILFKDHMARFNIILLYSYKVLRLRILGLKSLWPLSQDSNLVSSPRYGFSFETDFQLWGLKLTISVYIHKKCYFPVKFVVSLITFVRDCSLFSLANTGFPVLRKPYDIYWFSLSTPHFIASTFCILSWENKIRATTKGVVFWLDVTCGFSQSIYFCVYVMVFWCYQSSFPRFKPKRIIWLCHCCLFNVFNVLLCYV